MIASSISAVIAALAGFWLGRRRTASEQVQRRADLDRMEALMRAAARADREGRHE